MSAHSSSSSQSSILPYNFTNNLKDHVFTDSGYKKIAIGESKQKDFPGFVNKVKKTLDKLNETKTGKILLGKIAGAETPGSVPEWPKAKIAIVSTISVGMHAMKGGEGETGTTNWGACMWDPTDDWITFQRLMMGAGTGNPLPKEKFLQLDKFVEQTPPEVSLFHELLHSWHFIEKVHGRSYRDEEAITIGFGEFTRTDGLNENALRRELDLPLRTSHEFAVDFDAGAWTYRHRFRP